jgi:hypothetical protein
VHDVVRETCIRLQLVCPRTKKPYDEHTNINTLVENFLDRCLKKGVVLIWRNGRKLSLARALKSNWCVLAQYSKLASRALLAFQTKHGVKLTLLDVGNFDECQLDLCDFAEKGCFLCFGPYGNNVIVPYVPLDPLRDPC